MSAKPVKKAAPQGPASLVDTLQSEVAAEASPLLQLLVNNARYIALLLVLFLVVIAAYWVYSSQTHKQSQKDLRALGEILVTADPVKRLERLRAYVPDAPASVRNQGWFAIMSTARELGNHQISYEAWEKISGFGESMKATAVMGMVTALADQGRLKEAHDLLRARLGEFSGQDRLVMNMRIVQLAESLGDTQSALAACDAIISEPEAAEEARFWRQRRAALAETTDAPEAKEQP